jgi:long-chain-fatty-acid--CoA ligase ACSBG
VNYQQYWDFCMQFAKSLIKLDVPAFHIVNILGFNSVSTYISLTLSSLTQSLSLHSLTHSLTQAEWFIANTGSMLAGCIAAGIYSTNSAEACHYISDHSRAEVVVVEDNKQLQKYASAGSSLPHVKALVVWGEPVQASLAAQIQSHHSSTGSAPAVLSWESFLQLGHDVPLSAVDRRWALIRPGNCASLIYTSGTTGPPKSVMISHDNLTWTARNIVEHYMVLNHEDRAVSYLPLSHIAAQLIDIHCIMLLGGSAWFAQPDALKGSLTATLKQVRPTFFFGVPRVWEKIQEKMAQMGRETTGLLKLVSTFAKQTALEKSKRAQFGAGGGTPCGFACVNALVLRKIKEALGLDQTKGCFTAAAPISPDTLWYFASLDIPVYEVFGQSECTGPHTVSASDCWKIGYCGRPIKGSQSKIDPRNGELCYRGRHIFMGYMHNEEETRKTIDDEGYLHSGDVGEFDDNEDPDIPSPSGFMKITGRIKELIITAGGENVPPVLIENEMKTAMLAVSNVMVVGDQRKFLTMLVSLKTDVDHEHGMPTDQLAADSLFVSEQIGSSAKTYSAAKECSSWKAYIDKGMEAANAKTTSNAQIVQKWAWVPQDFSERGGELTPTLKLKRSIVSGKYAHIVDNLYSGTD